jgi:hypothetical protein
MFCRGLFRVFRVTCLSRARGFRGTVLVSPQGNRIWPDAASEKFGLRGFFLLRALAGGFFGGQGVGFVWVARVGFFRVKWAISGKLGISSDETWWFLALEPRRRDGPKGFYDEYGSGRACPRFPPGAMFRRAPWILDTEMKPRMNADAHG